MLFVGVKKYKFSGSSTVAAGGLFKEEGGAHCQWEEYRSLGASQNVSEETLYFLLIANQTDIPFSRVVYLVFLPMGPGMLAYLSHTALLAEEEIKLETKYYPFTTGQHSDFKLQFSPPRHMVCLLMCRQKNLVIDLGEESYKIPQLSISWPSWGLLRGCWLKTKTKTVITTVVKTCHLRTAFTKHLVALGGSWDHAESELLLQPVWECGSNR